MFGHKAAKPQSNSKKAVKTKQVLVLPPAPSSTAGRDSLTDASRPASRVRSRRTLEDAENLVHIKVLNVDPKAPDFHTKYNNTNRWGLIL